MPSKTVSDQDLPAVLTGGNSLTLAITPKKFTPLARNQMFRAACSATGNASSRVSVAISHSLDIIPVTSITAKTQRVILSKEARSELIELWFS
jgi:hypothetical protein